MKTLGKLVCMLALVACFPQVLCVAFWVLVGIWLLAHVLEEIGSGRSGSETKPRI